MSCAINVVGGGIGGLSFALAIRRARRDVLVRVFEKNDMRNEHKKAVHIGLWSPALRALSLLDVYPKIANEFEPVMKSCYMDSTGCILAQPARQLGMPDRKFESPSLMFVREDTLMQTLREVC